MKNTRFMERLFSATREGDEEITLQVAQDIEDAKRDGKVDTEEVTYESNGDGSVSITDKGNGEVTIAEQAEDGQYDLYPAQVSQQIEGFLHPEGDGVTPGQQVGAPDEYVEGHEGLENGISQSTPYERSVEEEAIMGPDGEGVREFSVSTNNSVVLRIFSDQEFCERMFSEVIDSEETAIVGDLKIEKVPGEDAVIVTSQETGDQAKVDMEDDTMDVTELDSKNFSEECCGECEPGIDAEVELGGEQYLPLHVVGIDAFNHVLVDAVEYDIDSAQDLVNQLTEQGVDAVQIFDDPDSARDYASDLLANLGVDSPDQIDEPEQVEFSYFDDVFVTRFYSDSTDYMIRLFSETVNDIEASQSTIEDAIENGDEIETDDEIITPIDSTTAIVEDKDNGEFTKVVIAGDDMDLSPISEDEAEELTDGLIVSEDEVDEDEKNYSDIWEDYYYDEREFSEYDDYSDIWTNEEETKFFSEYEEMTDYMARLFSDEADSEDIEDAIESGEQIETDDEIITPVDAHTAVIEDKETGEFTKAVLDDEKLDLNPISENEADELTEDLAVEDEKDYSDVWTNDEETRFFSENEEMTDYMLRIFSEEADQDEVEDAIESGEQIENDYEVITPVDSTTAVIEDKETGEFTKATIVSDDDMNMEAISEEEADELTDDIVVKNSKEDDAKEFSDTNPLLAKFFADINAGSGAEEEGQAMIEQGQAMIEQGQAMIEEAQAAADMGGMRPSVEMVEDKAQAAIQAIQEMTEQAQAAIMEAKEAPVQGQEDDLREAQFSDYGADILDVNNTALSWLSSNMK